MVASSGCRTGSPTRQHAARGRVDGRALGLGGHESGEDLDHVGLLGVQRHALAGQARGRAGQVAERQRAVGARGLPDARRHAVAPHRGGADVEDLVGVAEGDVDGHELGPAPEVGAAAGGLDREVEHDPLARAVGDEHVAAGAQAGQERLGDERGQQRRQGGVDGVAARAQDVCAGLRGQRVSCGDYPRGMNSGTSRSARLRLARVGRSRRLIARLAARLLEPPGGARLVASAAWRDAVGVAGGHHRHPHLVVELVVDHGAEDDVGLGVGRLGHGLGPPR